MDEDSEENQEPVKLNRLPSSTVKLIGSAQVITSVSSVVKELMENSIDAGATNIEVKLENHGLDRLEVKDNGCGIKREDVKFMCKKSYTSKISDFSDLDKLNSYGFRGEALSSLCAVAKVSITTKTENDDIGSTYIFNNNGDVVTSLISHIIKGTTVVVEDLFKNLPVRKQFLTSGKRKSEELKKVETLVKTLALINHGVRVYLTHNKFAIWQKSAVCSIMSSFVQVLPPTIIKQLYEINHEEDNIKITLMIPKTECNISSTCYGNPMDAIFLFINSRPVRDKHIEKAIHEEVYQYFGSSIPVNRYPTCLASILLPPDCLDVNLEPNKTKVIIKDQDVLLKLIKKLLVSYYSGEIEFPELSQEVKASLKRKIESNVTEVIPKIAKTECREPLNILEESTIDIESEIDKIKSFDKTTGFTESQNILEESTIDIQREIDKIKSIETTREFTETQNILEESTIDIENEIDKIKSTLDLSNESQDLEVNTAKDEKEISDLVQSIFRKQEINQHTESNTEKTAENPLTELSMECVETTLADWSRGNVKFHGQAIEGTTVVAKPEESICDVSTNSSASQISERSVSSQMGQKDMAAFTKFAREFRTEIIKESPGITFTTVASELASRWKKLQESEKQTYKELAKIEKDKKKHKEVIKPPIFESKKIDKTPKKTFSKTSLWKITLDNIKKSIIKRAENLSSKPLELVGKINDDLMLIKEKGDISIFSSRRLNESVKYYNNLCHMSVPAKVLEKKIPITKDLIGDDLWDIMSELETTFDEKSHKMMISSSKIINNGLRIEKNESEFFITDVPLNISFFGIDELIEILKEIKNRSNCKIVHARPLKIVNYIRSETIRSLTENSPKVNESYVLEVYKFWTDKARGETSNCPHFYPVSKRIYENNKM